MGISHQHTSKRAWSTAAFLVAGAAVLTTGCGSVTSGAGANPPTTPSASPAASSPSIPCGAVTSLRTTLTNLTHVKPGPSASGQIAADLSNIKMQLATLQKSAAVQVTQAGPLDQAIDRIGPAASAAASHPSSATVAALASALGQLNAALQPVLGDIKTACPSP
jgi:hypothetical protein